MSDNINDWASAIALRIVDELDCIADFPEDGSIIRNVLEKLFVENAWATEALIGTGLIEEDHFISI